MADYKQCRECIKQDTCTFKILKSKEIDCQYFIDKDVVPRSEVEKIFAEIEYLIWQYDTHPANELKKELAELKKKYVGEVIENEK